MGRAMLFSVCRGGKVDAGLALHLLLLLPLLADGVAAMDCSRFPMWNACRGAVSYHGLEETLLPEAPKRSQVIQQQSPFYLASSGWGYKRNPFMVYPRMNTGLSVDDPRRMDQGLSIFDPRGKKAPLQRNGNHLFSTIIRKQAGGLKEDLEGM